MVATFKETYEIRSWKQSDNKENQFIGETCKPEVASDCSDCIKLRLEIEGLKTKIEKLERRLHFAWKLCKLFNRIKYHLLLHC